MEKSNKDSTFYNDEKIKNLFKELWATIFRKIFQNVSGVKKVVKFIPSKEDYDLIKEQIKTFI